jgi:hypothetical protein
MTEFVITDADILAAGREHPNAPPEYWPGFAFAKKGVRFKPTFSPLGVDHILPPFEVWEDKLAGTYHIRQGTPEDDQPASLEGLEVSDSDFGAFLDSGGTFNG